MNGLSAPCSARALTAAEAGATVALISATPLAQRDAIREAKRAWMAGEFARVPGDEKEWIPIPEVPKTVSYP